MGLKYSIDCKTKGNFFVDRENNITELYFNDIRQYPVLTEEEERETFFTFRHAVSEKERNSAKDKLINSNLRFVVSIAKKFGTSDTFFDLVSEGNIALIQAIDKYEPDKGYRLITYAITWIVAAINKYLVTQLKPVVPPNALKINNYVKATVKEFYSKNERNPSSREIADIIREKYNFNISNFDDIEIGHFISIDEKCTLSDDEGTVEDSQPFTERTSSNNVQETIDEDYKRHKVDFLLGKLSERERYVVERVYGIGCQEESYDTIGLRLNLCGERVRQICNLAVKKMKDYKDTIKD